MHKRARVVYKGYYNDAHGSVAIEVVNDHSRISCVIDDVCFSGSEFSALCCHHGYTDAQLARFSFYNEPNEMLCDCSFSLALPQVLIETASNSEISVMIDLRYTLGKARSNKTGGIDSEHVAMAVVVDGSRYEGSGDSFETAMIELYAQWKGRYVFKNCFGCALSDYHPVGNSSFGTMMCFLAQKETYMTIQTKEAFLQKLTDDFDTVQEIYCCDCFEIRKNHTGYRG